MKNILIFLSIFIFLLNPCYSQKSSILLAGKTLNLGMKKKVVVQLYEDHYKLQKLPSNENEFVLITKDGPPYLPKGVVRFEKNKLVYIRKMWGQFNNNELMKFAGTLNNLISQLTKNGEMSALVFSSIGTIEPDLEENNINFFFNDHKIEIHISKSDEFGNNVSIFESIYKSNQTK